MPSSDGYKNIIPANQRTHEENVANGRKGAIASAAAKREKKLFREVIENKLGDSLENIVDAIIKRAKSGDIQASTFLRDTVGEKPTDKVETEIKNKIVIDLQEDEDE